MKGNNTFVAVKPREGNTNNNVIYNVALKLQGNNF